MSRYDRPCPACGATIRPSDIHLYGDSFPCPACGEWLKYDYKHVLSIWGLSVLVASILAWYLGYRGAMLILVGTCATLLLCASAFFFMAMFDPSGFKRLQQGKGKPFDGALSLHLTEKPDDDKKTNP